jgi:hypothetical protein
MAIDIDGLKAVRTGHDLLAPRAASPRQKVSCCCASHRGLRREALPNRCNTAAPTAQATESRA